MLVIRYWKPSDHNGGVSPFGSPGDVLTEQAATERVFRSLIDWCSQAETPYRIGCCDSQVLGKSRGALSAEALLPPIVAHRPSTHRRSPTAWRYLHVVHRTMHRDTARRLRGALIDIGKGIGACENSPHDPEDPIERAPYYLYVLAGQPVEDRAPAAEEEKTAPASLFDLAEL